MNKTTCLLCEAALEPLENGTQAHPEVDDCLVRFTDSWGVAISEPLARGSDPVIAEPMQLDITFFPFVDDVLEEIFAELGLPRLGGISSGRGWSSISTYQRCPFLWKKKYIEQVKPAFLVESPSLAIGSLIHTFLAVYYTRMIDQNYPLTPELVRDRCNSKANPAFVQDAWRVFVGYALFYQDENIKPLAIEHDLRDPRTGESCRYDLVAFFPDSIAGRPAGTYVCEHKSASRFDDATLDGWAGDGEVLGQVALWKKLGLDHRFGKLQGVLVNLLGKQKYPQYHRTWVSPESWQIESHLDDLRRYEGLLQLSRSSDNFPRARNGCIGRYGKCAFWDACAGADR